MASRCARFVVFASTLTATLPAQARAPVRYTLTYDGDSATVAVTMTLPNTVSGAVDVAIPRAIPMGYGTQLYDRFVRGLVARDARGDSIAITDIDGPRWRVAASASHALASISYRVDVRQMEAAILNAGDASRIRPRYLGLLGYSVFCYVDALLNAPVVLDVRVPAAWTVLTTRDTVSARGALSVQARDYLALADAQLFAGPDLQLTRVAGRTPFTLALYSEQPWFDAPALAALADSALRHTIDYFGNTTLPHYTASVELLTPISAQHEYRFSMEHLESATYRFAVGQLDVGAAGRDRTYYSLLHHAVHSWLPKQCAPAGYYPVTWDYAAPIDGIWFSEGWAQYIAADIFGGDGADGERRRRERVALRFAGPAADTLPPIRGRSTTELSRVAAHQYSDDFRISATVFSRGALMAQAIDERIRNATRGRMQFRDVARGVMEWCAHSRAPVTSAILADVIRQRTHVDVRDLITQWLAPRGSAPPDRARP